MKERQAPKNAFHITITGTGYSQEDGKIYNTLQFDLEYQMPYYLYFTGVYYEADKSRIAAQIPQASNVENIIYILEGNTISNVARSLLKALSNNTFIKQNFYLDLISMASGELHENGDTIRFRLKKNHATNYVFYFIAKDKENLEQLFATYDNDNPFEHPGLEGEEGDEEEGESGFFIKNNIANIQFPAQISLASNPNFIQFQKKGRDAEEEKMPTVSIQIVNQAPDTPPKFSILETRTGNANTFTGVDYANIPSKSEFNYGSNGGGQQETADSLVKCLRRNEFVSRNFDIATRSSLGNKVWIDLTLKNWESNYLFEFDFEDSFLKYAEVDKYTHPFITKNDEMVIEVLSPASYPAPDNFVVFTITDKSTHTLYEIKATRKEEFINASTFFLDANASITAQNLKACLLNNYFVSANFHLNTGIQEVAGETLSSNRISITPLDVNAIAATTIGVQYNNIIRMHGGIYGNIEMNKAVLEPIKGRDSILGNSEEALIELEIYSHTGNFLGENKFPDSSLGTYMTTLSKSYHGKPLWFNLNALMENNATFLTDFLRPSNPRRQSDSGWRNAGTATDYRYMARRFDKKNREPFYLSNILYSITGYNRNLESNNLIDYVFDAQGINTGVKPLTNQPMAMHVKGQTQYFNFILSDSQRDVSQELGLVCKLFTQTGSLQYQEAIHISDKKTLHVVNTVKIDIDGVIERYQAQEGDRAKNIGYVEVHLAKSPNTSIQYTGQAEELITEKQKMTFRILPHCLYKVKDFAFLNSLGGWSSFNFGGNIKTDFKASANTIFKTQTPEHTISSEIEAVYDKEVKEQFVVETTPIAVQTVDWLKEMSSSIAVYELATKRYVVVDELTINPNSIDELFKVQMKYRYSDSYNGTIN